MSHLDLLRKVKDLHKLNVEDLRAERNRLAHIMIKEHFNFKEVMKCKDAEILALEKACEATQKEVLRMTSLLEKAEKNSNQYPACKRRKDDNDQTDYSNEGMSTSAREESTSSSHLQEKEAHLISLVSIFLNFLPFGTSIEHICSFINQNIDPNIKAEDVENFLKRYPLFKQNTTGIPTLSKNWSINM